MYFRHFFIAILLLGISLFLHSGDFLTRGQTDSRERREDRQTEELVVEGNDLNYVDSSDSTELPPFCASLRDVVRVTYKGPGSSSPLSPVP